MAEQTLQNGHLSIELGGGFSFVAKADRNSRRMMELELVPLPGLGTEGALYLTEHSKLIREKYNSVSLSYCHGKFVLLPDSLFVPENSREILALNTEISPTEDVAVMDIPALMAKLIFVSDKNSAKAIEKLHPMCRESHCAGHLLNLCRKLDLQGDNIVCYFYPGFFLMAAFRSDQLHMINAFPCRDHQDAVYYFLYACEQLKMDSGKISLYAGGEIAEEHEIALALNKYSAGIQFLKSIPGIEQDEKIKQAGQHRFLTLTDQFRCAL